MQYNNIEFKKYDKYYYVSANGEVYSKYKEALLKHYIDHDGYHRVDIHSKHIKIHKLVYMVWIGDIPEGKQVNHYDDDKNNNHYKNLYLGSQKENVKDCIRNEHRLGNVVAVKVYNKAIDRVIEFSSVKAFIEYTGHHVANGSLSHIRNKKWFKERYDIIERKGVTTIESYKSIRAKNSWVENKAILHEASRVG